MKRYAIFGLLVVFFSILGVRGAVFAADTASESDKQSGSSAASAAEASSDPDDAAHTPEGAARLRQRLASEFQVKPAIIDQLRDQHLGYGEIRHALSLAQQLPGGITDDNLHHVMSLRQDQHLGWGQIAHQLGVKLGPVTKSAATSSTGSSSNASSQPESLTRPGASHADADHGNGRDTTTLPDSDEMAIERPGKGKGNGWSGGTPGGGAFSHSEFGSGAGFAGRSPGKSSHANGHGR